jgi:tight adherence protein B
MWIVAASFLGIFLIFIGLYWAFIVRPEAVAERALGRRLNLTKSQQKRQQSLASEIAPRSTLPFLNSVFNRFSAIPLAVEQQVLQAGLTLTAGQVVLGSLFAATFGLFLGLQLSRSLLIGVLGAAVLGAAPIMVIRFLARRRVAKFEEQFPEAIDLIARALRAGHALTTGIGMVAEEVPEPVKGEFQLLHDRQNYGMPLSDALRLFADRVPLLDARFFATAILTQRESGGNLAEVLDSLAAIIRDRFRLKRQVRVLSAHGRITGMVLACLPFAIAGLLFLIAPAHLLLLFTDPIGLWMVGVAGVLQVIGFIAMRRIVNIEV